MKVKNIFFYIFLILLVAINVFILVEGATGGNDSASQSMGFTQMFIDLVKRIDPNSPIVKNPEITHSVIRKLVGHFGLFGLSGIILIVDFLLANDIYLAKKSDIVLISLVFGFGIALLSEVLQYFAPGRFMAFTDVLIDYAGFILFGGLTFLIGYLIYRHKNKKEIKE